MAGFICVSLFPLPGTDYSSARLNTACSFPGCASGLLGQGAVEFWQGPVGGVVLGQLFHQGGVFPRRFAQQIEQEGVKPVRHRLAQDIQLFIAKGAVTVQFIDRSIAQAVGSNDQCKFSDSFLIHGTPGCGSVFTKPSHNHRAGKGRLVKGKIVGGCGEREDFFASGTTGPDGPAAGRMAGRYR